MARPKKSTLNLASTPVADGALPSTVSVYEICGIRTATFAKSTFEDYSDHLAKMNLLQLHDEAYNHGLSASGSREIMIDRLEKKFCEEARRFRSDTQKALAKNAPKKEFADMTVEEQAKAIMAKLGGNRSR